MAKLNEKAVKALPVPERGNRITYFSGALLQGQRAPGGFGVRVTSKGVRSFVLNYYQRGHEHRLTIGQWPTWSALAAVKEARTLRQRIDRGENPLTERRKPAGTAINDLLDQFIAGHVLARRHRRATDTIGIIDRTIRPAIGKLAIADVKRSHLMRMLDEIAVERGPWMADRSLRVIRTAFNWWALRNDDFVSPIVRGMARVKETTRDRVVADSELHKLWNAGQGVFGAFVRFLVLTGARRNEAARMSRAEVVGDVWLIPAARYKTQVDHAVPLSSAAQAILADLPSPYPFSVKDGKPIGAFGKYKIRLDTASGVTGWRLHDLRRTTRSLLSRAGVAPHIAEQCLGHKIRGVAGIYDRHHYATEKREAFEKLAALVSQIVGDQHG